MNSVPQKYNVVQVNLVTPTIKKRTIQLNINSISTVLKAGLYGKRLFSGRGKIFGVEYFEKVAVVPKFDNCPDEKMIK